MKGIVKHCKMCEQNPNEYREYFDKIFTDAGFQQGFVDLGVIGYYTVDENRDFCQIHPDEKLEISPLSCEEYGVISSISNNLTFVHAMEDLKQSSPIEFQLKLSQFKTSLTQQENNIKTDNQPKCPICNSTNLSKISVAKKATKIGLFGIFGAGDLGKAWKCNNCGSKF